MLKKKFGILFLVCSLAFVCVLTAGAYEETYEDTLQMGQNGEYSCRVPYGFTWTVDDVDGTIGGEDATICTTVEAYEKSNPNWAITNILEKQPDGTYIAVRRAIVAEGYLPKIELKENQVAFVVHSGGSVPQNCLGSYANWMGKVVACSIRTGDVFEVDLTSDPMTVYAVGPGKQEDTSKPSAESNANAPVSHSTEENDLSRDPEASDVSQQTETDQNGMIPIVIAIVLAGTAGMIVTVAVIKRKKCL